MTLSNHPHVKGEKPRIHTFTTEPCAAWQTEWSANGFVPVVLPGDGPLKEALKKHAEAFLKRIQSRGPTHPSLDGYLRWVATALVAPESQYVFMVQPNIFPGNLQKKALLTEAMARYVTADKLVLLAGSDAIMGTKVAFLRMLNLLASDHGVTKDNATDGFIVRRVAEQFPDFIIDMPYCKEMGDEGWEESPLERRHNP